MTDRTRESAFVPPDGAQARRLLLNLGYMLGCLHDEETRKVIVAALKAGPQCLNREYLVLLRNEIDALLKETVPELAKGGQALSPERRAEIAKKANRARWSKPES